MMLSNFIYLVMIFAIFSHNSFAAYKRPIYTPQYRPIEKPPQDILEGQDFDAGYQCRLIEGQVINFIETSLKDYMINIIINHGAEDIPHYGTRFKYNKMLLNNLIQDIERENYIFVRGDCTGPFNNQINREDALAGNGDLYGPIRFNITSLARDGFRIDRIVGMAFHEYAHHTRFPDKSHRLAGYFTNIASHGQRKSPYNNLRQVKRLIKLQQLIRGQYKCFKEHDIFMSIVLNNPDDLKELIKRKSPDLNQMLYCSLPNSIKNITNRHVQVSPLMLAVILGNIEIIKVLLNNNANFHLKNSNDLGVFDFIKMYPEKNHLKQQLLAVFERAKNNPYHPHRGALDFGQSGHSRQYINKIIYQQFKQGPQLKHASIKRNGKVSTDDCQIIFYDKKNDSALKTKTAGWINNHYVENGMNRSGRLFGYFLQCNELKALLYVPPSLITLPKGHFPFFGKIDYQDIKFEDGNILVRFKGKRMRNRKKSRTGFFSHFNWGQSNSFSSRNYDREVLMTLRAYDYALLKIEAEMKVSGNKDFYTIEFRPRDNNNN